MYSGRAVWDMESHGTDGSTFDPITPITYCLLQRDQRVREHPNVIEDYGRSYLRERHYQH